MAYTVSQIEKHTLVTRLSVSIYKMTDDQLSNLLDIFEQGAGSTDGDGEYMATLPSANNDAMRRQMIMARLFVLIKQMDKDTLLDRLHLFEHPDFRWVREFPRLACYLLVDFASEGKAYRSLIRDISASGVFIETAEKFEKGQEVALCFTLAESNETLPFKIKGRVSRVFPNGIGVHYENITHYQREIINALLKKAN